MKTWRKKPEIRRLMADAQLSKPLRIFQSKQK